MATSGKETSRNNLSGVLAAAATAAVGAAVTLAEYAVDKIREHKETQKELVTIPPISNREFPVTLDQAIDMLNSCGLKAIPSEIKSTEPNQKYKDCFNFQVVKSNPSQNSKVKPGTPVVLRYVTEEVIMESNKIFVESEKQKADLKMQKALKRSEHRQSIIVVKDKARDKLLTLTKKQSESRKPEEDIVD